MVGSKDCVFIAYAEGAEILTGDPGVETSGVSSCDDGLGALPGCSHSALWFFQACFWHALEQ